MIFAPVFLGFAFHGDVVAPRAGRRFLSRDRRGRLRLFRRAHGEGGKKAFEVLAMT
jgi:hypothetical protein